MAEFLSTAFTMPTAVWSVLLVLVIFYWTISLFGIFDLEMLDGLDGAAEGLTSVADAADGMLDAADGMLDGAEGFLEGAEGLIDGADGLAEGPALEAKPGFFDNVGFGEVPRIITLSLVTIFGWTTSFFGTSWLEQSSWVEGLGILASNSLLVGSGVAAASLGLGIVGAAVAIQPLRRLLKFHVGPSRNEFIGRTCIVKTTRVDAEFGQAEMDTGQLVQVRNRGGETFERGEKVVIFDYDKAHEVFLITPLDDELE